MKKNLSRVLALALVLASLLSLTVGASADGTKVVIPNKISRLEAQLPEREAQPTVKTKTANGEILVRVSGDPDTVYANWLGYGESKEEVELENGIGVVELEGHKYQLGAKYNKVQNRKYYVLDTDPDTFDPEDDSTYTWQSVKYYGSVKVGTYDMKLVSTGYQDIFPTADAESPVFWAWIYKNANGKAVTDEVTNPSDPSTETTGIYAAGDGVKTGVVEVEEQLRTDVDVVSKTNAVTYDVAALVDADGAEQATRVSAVDLKGNEGTANDWVPMVPSYMFRAEVIGKESNGAPNYAWIVTKGPWTSVYTRAGKMEYTIKDEENTDYFKTGLAGSTGTVTWKHRKTKAGTTWYVSEVVENYAEGDIASAVAQYNVNGNLETYYIVYRTGEDETYEIQYTPANKPANGEYVGKDEFTGETIKAYANSLKTWRDKATGKLTSQVELDWGLTPLKDWTNPPRLTK